MSNKRSRLHASDINLLARAAASIIVPEWDFMNSRSVEVLTDSVTIP
ncbi:MAG: hypothetical protein O2983_06245 [Planctomycetota bacterium]|nr:hypothetical protein [Planctomycetota bacterium]